MTDDRRAYEELRSAIESLGGSMSYVREGSQHGAWEITLGNRSGRFESNGAGFPDLDPLYVPKVAAPKHWSNYSTELVPDAIAILLSKLS